MKTMEQIMDVEQVISEAHIYLNQVYAAKKFSFGTWTSRQHVFLSMKAGEETGWGENIITVNQPDVSLEEWSGWMNELVGMTVSQALMYLRDHLDIWQDRMTEMTEMCLVDLAGKLKKKNALELLQLPGREPVNSVFVILSDDPEHVEKRVQYAMACGKTKFIKIKLFGDLELDLKVIGAVRKYLSREETYVIGDVNCGYRPDGETGELTEIAEHLRLLKEAGLDACEDPAYLSKEEWVKLQELVGDLALIPDYPMRPARKAAETICPGMGHIYNIHPGSAASIIDAISLGDKIKSLGVKLMIGDDSLIGPGCTIWQQLAVGLSASWVEAAEKETESDAYYKCVRKIATNSVNNPVSIDVTAHGFGVYLNEEAVRNQADRTVDCLGV